MALTGHTVTKHSVRSWWGITLVADNADTIYIRVLQWLQVSSHWKLIHESYRNIQYNKEFWKINSDALFICSSRKRYLSDFYIWWKVGVWFPEGTGNFSLQWHMQTDDGAQPVACAVGTGGLYLGSTVARVWSWSITPIQCHEKKVQRCTRLFGMIVGVLTTCHTQYTWDSSICIFLFNRTTLQVLLHTL